MNLDRSTGVTFSPRDGVFFPGFPFLAPIGLSKTKRVTTPFTLGNREVLIAFIEYFLAFDRGDLDLVGRTCLDGSGNFVDELTVILGFLGYPLMMLT